MEIENNALQFECPTCGARPGLKCYEWIWNINFVRSVFTDLDGVHQARKIEAAKAVSARLRPKVQFGFDPASGSHFQFGFTGFKTILNDESYPAGGYVLDLNAVKV